MAEEKTIDFTEFDLRDKYQIQIPVDGKMVYVERIYKDKVDPNNILWQVHRCNIDFRDNIPVNLYYNINTPTAPTPILGQKRAIMYLVPIGSIDKYGSILRNFTLNNYARTPIYINWLKTNSFELNLKIQTGSNVSTRQELFSMTNTESIELEILSNRLHWEQRDVYGKTILSTNKTYFVKVVKNNTSFKVYLSADGIKYNLDIDSTANFNVKNEWMHFGIDKVCGGSTVEPFLGTIDLSQSTFLYDNIDYQLDMYVDSYWELIRGGNVAVNNQVISGFRINKSLANCNYAYSKNYIDWTSTNSFEVCIKIHTGANTSSSQELITWRDYNPNCPNTKSTTWLNNDFCITNGKIKWEYTQQLTSGTTNIAANKDYYVVFTRNKNSGQLKVLNANKTVIQTLNITKFPANCKQYMYLGLDEMSLQSYDYFSGHCVYTGSIDCKESYVIINNKQYKFRI